MAVLRPESRLGNVERSLNAYVTATIVAAGIPVLFLEYALPDTLPVRRVEISYLPMGQRRDTGRVMVGIGHERELVANCNCVEQTGTHLFNSAQVTHYSLAEMVDQVYDAFAPQAAIAIRNYAAVGTPVVGWMHVRRRDQNNVPVPNGVPAKVRNVSILMGYEEDFA